MDRPLALLLTSVVLSTIVWITIVRRYAWPTMRAGPWQDAVRPMLLLHAFRFIGLAFLVPGVVSPDLPIEFARPAAYGDLVAAVLALVALWSLRTPAATSLVWIFNIFGTADLLFALYQGLFGVGVEPGQLGAAYFIPTVVVPLLLVTHAVVFVVLVRGSRAEPAPRM
ncbi:MAG: hypothetical protein OER90_01365 [Gemmatimonadota bacterium]|nr:hypothetical protein [Gemmatimonadota bacterium]